MVFLQPNYVKMINKIIFILYNYIFNNWLILKFKSTKFKTLNYNYDFLNISFEDPEDLIEDLEMGLSAVKKLAK